MKNAILSLMLPVRLKCSALAWTTRRAPRKRKWMASIGVLLTRCRRARNRGGRVIERIGAGGVREGARFHPIRRNEERCQALPDLVTIARRGPLRDTWPKPSARRPRDRK